MKERAQGNVFHLLVSPKAPSNTDKVSVQHLSPPPFHTSRRKVIAQMLRPSQPFAPAQQPSRNEQGHHASWPPPPGHLGFSPSGLVGAMFIGQGVERPGQSR